jgi:hypothetical protein
LLEGNDMRTRTLWFIVRIYFVLLIYLEVALILAGNGIATFPWGSLELGPKEFADQGVMFMLAVPGLLGTYIVNKKRRIESGPPNA